MTLLQSILLGALQGVAEFLPISSSGHLVIFRQILGITDIPVLFDVLLHVSTLLVICIFFRRRIIGIILSLGRFISRKASEDDISNLKLFYAIIIATVVTAVIGLGISFLDAESYPKLVSALFLVTAVILICSRFAGKREGYRHPGWREGLITGFAQGLGVLPGISRSGITISAALFSGIDKEHAGEFAFLISIPAVLGALILELKDTGELFLDISAGNLTAGIISAFIFGILSLRLVLNLLKHAKIHWFALYLIPLGIAGLILL